MQPLRKPSDPALTPAPAESASSDYAIPVDEYLVYDGNLPISPALLLRQQLAARLAEAAASGQPAASVAAELVDGKWPMAMRLMTIVTISLALWTGIILTTLSLTTK